MRSLIIAALLLPMTVLAEPGPLTQYLAGERASLLDIGMVRLRALTTEFRERVGLHWTDRGKPKFFKAEINSLYQQTDDKIYVYLTIMDSGPTESQMAEGCENAMWQMNIWLTKSLPGLFIHTASDDQGMPPDLHDSLPRLFELRCYFSSSRDSSDGRFWASRSLGSWDDRRMNIGKWKIQDE